MNRLFIGLCALLLPLTPGYSKTFSIHQWQTSNGTRVAFYQAMEIPMLHVTLAFRAGAAYDGNQFGLSRLTTQLLNQGTTSQDANAIADQFAMHGSQYQSDTTLDMAILNVKTLTEEKPLHDTINLLNQMVTKPSFPQQAFEREKNIQRLAIAQSHERPTEVANQAFFKALYSNHPYGHPVLGEDETVNKIGINEVKQFYTQHFVASNAVLILVGAIEAAKAHELAEQIVRGMATGQASALILKAHSSAQTKPVTIAFTSTQSILRLGQIGIDYHCNDYFPLLVGNYILGGGDLVSRLSQEIREKRGLTYGVNSQFTPLPGLGPFVISLATQSEQAPTAIELVKQTLSQFITEGPSKEELIAAKRHLTGNFALSLASNSNIAARLLQIVFYELPNDYLTTYESNINRVSAASIQQAFKQQVHPENMHEILVGKI